MSDVTPADKPKELVIESRMIAGVNAYTTLQYLGAPKADGTRSYDEQHDRLFVTVANQPAKELERIVVETHAELAEVLPRKPKAPEDTGDDDLIIVKPGKPKEEPIPPSLGFGSGTTGLLICAPRNRNISVASLGDCRANILFYDTQTGKVRGTTLTVDQNTTNPEEQARVKRSGGDIVLKGGKPRLFRPTVPGEYNKERTAAISSCYGNYEFNGLMGRMPFLATFNLAQDPLNMGDNEVPILLVETDGVHLERPLEERLSALEDFIRAEKAAAQSAPASPTVEAANPDDAVTEAPPVEPQGIDDGDDLLLEVDVSTPTEPAPENEPEEDEPFVPDLEKLARHFMDNAIAAGSHDNMSLVVTRLDLTSIAVGMYDGNGSDGKTIAEAVCNLQKAKLELG